MKALLTYLERTQGSAAVREWLTSLELEREELADETRSISLQALRAALAAFVKLTSREAVLETWRDLVAPENAGAWVRVLRSARSPAEALALVDRAEDTGATARWETLEEGPGFWRGQIHIAHDPSLEQDGLLGLSRVADLTAIPHLFGYEHVAVVARGLTAPPGSDLAQAFEVRWREPRQARTAALAAATAGLGIGVPALGYAPSLGTAALALGSIVLGALGGSAWVREQKRRIDARAQAMRVRALERSLLLKESREREAVGNLEGSVVAGHYRIRQRMGSGASGVIFEAVRISDGLPVAIKLLRAAAAHDAMASDRLRREAEALGLAWHPNVVEVLDFGHLADGTAYLVMELLVGESLGTRLRNRGRLSTAETLPIALQIASALTAVHAAGVVHRDLKPSNVFLTAAPDDETGTEQVKLLDFGIARVEWEETRITNMGTALGTAGYMSPEQEGGGVVDARSDLYSLGALLHECLVGEPPGPQGRLWQLPSIAPGVYGESGVQVARVDPRWKAIIERALSADPNERFQDARSFAIALRELGKESVRPPQASST